MSEAQVRARHQQQVEELCAAAIRALSGEADLHFRGGRLHKGRRALPMYAPHLHPSLATDDFTAFRGAADGLALRLKHSDAALHASLCPEVPVERMVFDWLEQVRCEALLPAGMAGVQHNLRHAFEVWSLAFHHTGLTDGARGLLLYTALQMCRSRVSGEPVVEATEDLLEATRAAIAPLIGTALAGLRRERADQAAYAAHALTLARTLAGLLQGADAEAAGARPESDDDRERAAFALVMGPSVELTQQFATAVSGRSPLLDAAADGYRIFTTAHDREHRAGTLVRKELLTAYREQLDQRIAGQGVNRTRLARELHALLARPLRDGWDSGQEEGHIDGRRLAQLVASPTERRLFRTERDAPQADGCVTFLIDCSGSMKEHIDHLAGIVDVFVRALEQAGVASEVLGFTTGAWNGGRARRDWLRAGQPAHPGRLNEACHLVFKDADTPWRRARACIAALLKPDLFREGIDGEAVQWACRRMRDRVQGRMSSHDGERQRLIVVSDGSPMDSATNLANDAHYLDHHLKQVVMRHEQQGVEIYGLGVGLDLSPYYSRSHVLDLGGTVGMPVFREIVDMLRRGQHR